MESRELRSDGGEGEGTEEGTRLTDPVANPPAPSKATLCSSIFLVKAVWEEVGGRGERREPARRLARKQTLMCFNVKWVERRQLLP